MGRRLPLLEAIERPALAEMAEICTKYGVPYYVELKSYPRDWLVRGRLRVRLEGLQNEKVNTSMHHSFTFIPL